MKNHAEQKQGDNSLTLIASEISTWDDCALLTFFALLPTCNRNSLDAWYCVGQELENRKLLNSNGEIITANVSEDTRYCMLAHHLGTKGTEKLIHDLGFPSDLDAEWFELQAQNNPEYQEELQEARERFIAETEAREEKRLEEERHDPVYQAQLAESGRKFIAEHGLNLRPEPKSKEWYELDDDPDHEAGAVRLGARLEAQHARIAEHAAAEMERLENEYLRLYEEGAGKPIDTDAVRAQFRDFIQTILEKLSSDDAVSQQALDAAHAQLYGKDNFTIALVVGSLPEVPVPGSDEEALRSSLLGELETRGALEENLLNGNYFSSGETTLLRHLHPSLKFKAAA